MKTKITLKQKLLEASQPSWWKFAKRCNFLKLMTSNLLAVFLLFTLALIPTQSYSQITTGFELDGNAQAVAPNPPDDWDLIYNSTSGAQVTTGIVNDLSGTSDNIFTIGSKDQDDVSTWHWTIQSVPDKDEILHAGAALYDGTKIYFFADRYAVNGDAQIGFWLFKNAVSTNPDGSFNGTHAIGDILLLSNFSNGGGVSTIVAYEWVGSGGSDGTLNQIPVAGINLFAITNASLSPSPWPYEPKAGAAGSFPIGAFFEGGIDLAGLGFGIDPCFSSFLMETRSSTSIDAALKDFVFGSFFTRPQVTVNSSTSCVGGNSTVLTASIQGGVGPFFYAWSPGGATTPSISVSPSVTTVYTVVVTAANGCVANPATGTVVVNPLPACSIGDPNPPLNVVKCKVDAAAPGNSNTISTITNLDPNLYTLAWSIAPSQTVMTGWSITAGQGSNSITFQSGLCGTAGASVTISLTVTEIATGCSSTCTKIIVPQAPQCIADILPHGSLDCIVTTVTITGVGSSDNPPPTILWTAGNGGNIVGAANTLTIVVDASGTYTLTVTDPIDGCSVSATTTVTEDIRVPVLTLIPTNVSCFGLANGSINLSVSGGLAPYTFLWSTGATTEDVSGLIAGNYTVTVTGANGCISDTVVPITEPPVLTASITSKVDVLCFRGNTGSIDLSVSGGTAPYTYLWSNGATTQDISGLVAGNYSVVVTDSHSCTTTANATIEQPTELISSIAGKVDVLCNGGNNGSIDLNVVGGTSPYTYLWSNGATTQDISGLVAGNYSVVVTDSHSCTTTSSATINEASDLTASITSKVDVLCFGGNNGSIDLSVSGGTPAYTYLWSNGAITQDISGLVAGNYSVVVTDSHSCTATASATISQPTELVSSIANKVDVLCFGGNNGSIDLSVVGGTSPFTYLWSNGATTQDISGLVAGSYSVVVTDSHSCTTTASATINQPTQLVSSIAGKVDVLCFGGNNGSIDLSVSGGTSPFTYLWSNGATTQDVSGLIAGSYSVVVTDSHSCTTTASATINQPTQLLSHITGKVDILCFGGNNGSIDLSVSGGTAPHTYLWSNGATTQDISGLVAGNYSVVVTDSHSCTTTASATISQPAELLASIANKVDVLCFGGNNGSIDLNVFGGSPAYTYLWSNGATTQDISGLIVGSYSVVVTDSHSCTTTASATINQPPAVSCLLVAPEPLPICGSKDNVLTATVANAVSYIWSVTGDNGWVITAGQGTPSIIYSAGQDSAVFKLVVINSNGCKDSCSVIVKIGSCVRVKVFCTLTQGYWGQSNGVACATGERADVLVPRLLGAPFGDLVIGKPGRSLTITQAQAYCVTLRMPGGGPAAILPLGNQSFGSNCSTTIPLNNNGRFNNVLLGQTIALGLNLRLDTDLGALIITGTSLSTMSGNPGIDGLCGTEDDVPNFTSSQNKNIPQVVLNALNTIYGSTTVANLFDLANRALGGQSTGGATLKDINAAVSAINEGFDHCRFTEVNSNYVFTKGVINPDYTKDIVMKAFPNPFANSTTIEFMTRTDGNVNVSVYTLTGAQVAELFNGEVKADESKKVIFSGTNLPNGIYIYKIIADDKVYFDKLILQK